MLPPALMCVVGCEYVRWGLAAAAVALYTPGATQHQDLLQPLVQSCWQQACRYLLLLGTVGALTGGCLQLRLMLCTLLGQAAPTAAAAVSAWSNYHSQLHNLLPNPSVHLGLYGICFALQGHAQAARGTRSATGCCRTGEVYATAPFD
jgi:hypothetical protein